MRGFELYISSWLPWLQEFYRSFNGNVPGMTGPPNSFTARGPVTPTAILFTQLAV